MLSLILVIFTVKMLFCRYFDWLDHQSMKIRDPGAQPRKLLDFETSIWSEMAISKKISE